MYKMHSKCKSSMQLNQSTYVPMVIANIANIYVHECLQFLFDTYGHITPTDLSNNSVITSSYHGMQPHHLKC